ncbi:M1 family metallopeptidase [Robiginitalea sp. IMCC43444]|uniref:M1 family metallopeptidase n=1 Tax=Robiginitalea sp. IMCC43444 TaxID=3459121 RepID=UPI0040430287
MRISFRTFFLFFPMLLAMSQGADVDFQKAHISISPDTANAAIAGSVRYTFFGNGNVDSLHLDAQKMRIKKVTLENREVPFLYDGKRLGVLAPETAGVYNLQIDYTARPRQTLYFFGWNDSLPGNEQIWTQGQGKYSSHWVPSFDEMKEKVVFDLDIIFDPDYEVIANGQLQSKEVTGSLATWHYRMDKPMSSYLLAFAIGHFRADTVQSASGIPILNYFPKDDQELARNTYLHTATIFDFLEREIGYAYPWKNYKQVPLHDFMYAGMENTTATFFSDRYFTDSIAVNDLPYLNINAHEMAHQWFGNLVTETDGKNHWLHEGFATFYAYLAEAAIKGDDQMYWKLYSSCKALQKAQEEGRGRSLLDPGADSLTFYEKGAWALIFLREILGEDVYRAGIRKYLEKFAFRNATVNDFLSIMEGEWGKSLNTFRAAWLESPEFPYREALEYLRGKSASIRKFMESEKRLVAAALSDKELSEAWGDSRSPFYRKQLIKAFGDSLPENILEQVLAEGSLMEQKALVADGINLPPSLLKQTLNLLDAPSYELRETLLYRLWLSYPEQREIVLNRLQQNGSLVHLPLRQSWLLLTALTPAYQDVLAENLAALRKTTSPFYAAEDREKAFELLNQVDAFNNKNIKDLIQATEHHRWSFKKFSRALFLQLLEQRPDREYWEMVSRGFSRETYAYIYEKIEAL